MSHSLTHLLVLLLLLLAVLAKGDTQSTSYITPVQQQQQQEQEQQVEEQQQQLQNSTANWVHWITFGTNDYYCNGVVQRASSYMIDVCYPHTTQGQGSFMFTLNYFNSSGDLSFNYYYDGQCSYYDPDNSNNTILSINSCTTWLHSRFILTDVPVIPQKNALYYERYSWSWGNSNNFNNDTGCIIPNPEQNARYSVVEGVCLPDETVISQQQQQQYVRSERQDRYSLALTFASSSRCSGFPEYYSLVCSQYSSYNIYNAFPVINDYRITVSSIIIIDYNTIQLSGIGGTGWNGMALTYQVWYFDGNTYQRGCSRVTDGVCTIYTIPSGIETRFELTVNGANYLGVSPILLTESIIMPVLPAMQSLSVTDVSETSVSFAYQSFGGLTQYPTVYNITVNGVAHPECSTTLKCTVTDLPFNQSAVIRVSASNYNFSTPPMNIEQTLHEMVSISVFSIDTIRSMTTTSDIRVSYTTRGGLTSASRYSLSIDDTPVINCTETLENTCVIYNLTTLQTYTFKLIARNDGEAVYIRHSKILFRGFTVTTSFIASIAFAAVGLAIILGFAIRLYMVQAATINNKNYKGGKSGKEYKFLINK
ncbi:hypothetical protein SAMD00019534_099080 [Acytostelium subglobosum LB1]|uniref:hypothetical protein n=1 Tax=Acytostelium subglobosum LB1 TaxID=1410327 RepID=UPI00064508F3|nr:hypothetical protein SAMD00019534_099080 [Acytostelium subglobosum LB1]GAM26733.1 hypothetical protein SAMD00019534_099080 [Acytostelium subglobosum LB1]|eukprot:XP_012750394.1 hypothetical protein SAMD00019534_099080 [Acytostelium subglobosum LB1]